MWVTLVQQKQANWTFAIFLSNKAAVFKNSCHIEISCVNLIGWITAIASSTDADEINDAAPVISEIQETHFRNDILSEWE